MICRLCGSTSWKLVVEYTEPDQYEQVMGLDNIHREWCKCDKCGFYQSRSNYHFFHIEKFYKEGYRKAGFRKAPISEEFIRIGSIPNSENRYRLGWLNNNIPDFKKLEVLDYGSGIGVFPAQVPNVECVEVNEESRAFINDVLGIKCYRSMPTKVYDVVTCVHVLEHIKNPEDFLVSLSERTNKYIYIEIPDAVEFDNLQHDHDEFNCCHLHFYKAEHLVKLMDYCGIELKSLHRVYHKDRNLYRIMALGEVC